jgi:pyruvate ferredoxin oxidoreductase beta subunit
MSFKPIRTLFELPKEENLAPGHRMCSGCGVTIGVRQVLLAAPKDVIVVTATGCLEVSTVAHPYTAWRVPWVHVAFENTAAVASGIEAALKALERKGLGKRHPVIAFGGDGGTYDIGLQALSGALERGHRLLYICYDNEAYMNTGIQRSGGTPYGAWTTTTPYGKARPGKTEVKKDLMGIVVAHNIPYAATASVSHWKDLMNKVRKALSYDGPTFIHMLTPCDRGWRFDPDQTVRIAKLAVDTKFFPLYEVENGKYRITVPVPRPKPLEDYLKTQGRFKHLLRPEYAEVLEALKKQVDEYYRHVERMVKVTSENA